MLIHPWDEATPAEWEGVIRATTFGQLVTSGLVDGHPVVVPTHYAWEGGAALLHFARPNPVWRALEADPRAMLVLANDYTYVEAAWNKDRDVPPELGVPTSYYTAVQLLGTAEIVDDPDEKADILAVQLTLMEPSDSTRVRPTTDIESDRRQLPRIRAVRLHVEAVRAKMKYGGNRTAEERRSIAAHLADRDGPMDAAAREHLLRRLDQHD